jgi:hypothetical protein
MTTVPGIDYAWARPTIAEIKAAGARWVARYLSHDPRKNLSRGEYRDLVTAGLPVVAVWETTADRALSGGPAGHADAMDALVQAADAGLPANCVIHFAVDFDARPDQVSAYFTGISNVLHQDRVGVYGGLAVITWAAGLGYRYLWQTTAWSAGRWHPGATIRQTGGTVLHSSADRDLAMHPDWGQHPRPAIAPPRPTPTGTEPSEGTDMILVTVSHDEYPDAATWPGIFTYNGDKLRHVTTPRDETAFSHAGVPGPVEITKAQYESILAGH